MKGSRFYTNRIPHFVNWFKQLARYDGKELIPVEKVAELLELWKSLVDNARENGRDFEVMGVDPNRYSVYDHAQFILGYHFWDMLHHVSDNPAGIRQRERHQYRKDERAAFGKAINATYQALKAYGENPELFKEYKEIQHG